MTASPDSATPVAPAAAAQAPRLALLLHGRAPLLDYAGTLLGRPSVKLDRRQRLDDAFKAISANPPNLVIVEPQLLDGTARELAERLAAHPDVRRPPILRVGEATEVSKPWPFPTLSFTMPGGVDTFDQILTSLLRLPQRAAHRYTTRLNFAQKGLRAVLGQSVNISATGMLFSSTRPLDKGAEVEMEIMGVPSLHDISIRGRVLRQEPAKSILPHYAIEFIDPNADLRKRLQIFLDSESGAAA